MTDITRRTFMALVAAASAAPAFGRTQPDLDIGRLDAAIDGALADRRIVGAVVLVARDGVMAYGRAGGLADREAGRAMTLDTPFRFASVTKPFTTMTALKLIEAGRLSPDDLVTRWLPDFAPELDSGGRAQISVAHLMAHLAGLDYRFQQAGGGAYERAGVSDGLDEAAISLSENLRRIASVPLDLAPGERWRYSVATDVLGAVIAAAAGKAFPEAMKELVLDPLGLGARFFRGESDLAVPYRNDDPAPLRMNGVTEVPLPWVDGPGVRFDPGRIARKDAFPSGGAGLAGRAEDVLRLLETYRTGTFLPDRLRRSARQPRVGAEAAALGPGWGYSWMGGVLLDPVAAGSSLSAGSVSWGGVYGHSWAVDFERRLSVVVLTNTAYEGMIGQFPADVVLALKDVR